MNNELKEQFRDLANSLAPENLHCDGEISLAEADRKYRQLSKEWKSLEAVAGRKVSEEEIWREWADELFG